MIVAMMKMMMRIIIDYDLFSPLPPPSLTIFGYYHFIYNFLEFKLQRNQYRRIIFFLLQLFLS